MSETRRQLTVGVFILIGLVLAGVLAVLFSKGTPFHRQTYELRLKSSNVGGVKPGASVLLSGVQVGNVSGVELDPDGKSATISIRVEDRYQIYSDARFEIEPSGFLGDQFIAVHPGENMGELLKDGDAVDCQPPFNMQAALTSAAITIARIGDATTNLNSAVTDVRREVLNQESLRELASSLSRFARLTTHALDTVSNINVVVADNALPVTSAVSNLNSFAAQMTPLTGQLNDMLATNRETINLAIKNIETASSLLTNLLHDLGEGDGLAGRLVYDEQMADNFAAVAHNLSITSSNLNRLGLWGILWKKKEPRPQEPADRLRTPRDPFD